MGSVRVNCPFGFKIRATSARKSIVWRSSDGKMTPENTTSNEESGWDAVKKKRHTE